MSNLGYHAGDLGKAETYYNQSGGRSTGHFGTGTYFVSDPVKILHYNSRNGKEAPKHVVDFTGYKLYTPKNKDEAMELHNLLSDINNNKTYLFNKEVKDIMEVYKQLKKFISVSGIFSPRVDLLTSWRSNKTTFVELVNTLIDYINKYNEEHYMNPDLISHLDLEQFKDDENYWDTEDYIESVLNKILKENNFERDLEDYESTQRVYEELEKFFGSLNMARAIKQVQAVYDKYDSEGGWMNSYNKNWDSLSTVFMKALGYDGIDVRHLPEFDNTTYGSVIYDLKPETIVENLEESYDKYLYHATFGKYWEEIKKDGYIKKDNKHKNWDFSRQVICLANDPDVAESYCEASTEVDDETFDSGIVILAVDVSKLDESKLFPDPNVIVDKDDLFYNGDDAITCYEYIEDIPLDAVSEVIEEQLVEKIVKKGSKWQVQSEKGRNMGTYDTEDEAKKRLKQVEYFKHLNESKQDRINFENKVGKELSDKFFELKNRLNPPQNDLYYWMDKDISELENVLNSIGKSRKDRDDEARRGSEFIYGDDEWTVLKINTHEASKKYGKGTKWCISGEGDWKTRTNKYHNSKEVWDDYVNNHHANIWFFINDKTGHKYCVVECSVTLDGQTATGLEIYDDSNRMITEIPNAPRTSVPTYSEVTERLFMILDRYIDTNKITNIISYDPDEAMTHQDIRVDLDGEDSRYFRFDIQGRMSEISEKDLDVKLNEHMLRESLLLEKTRAELIDKSKKSDNYSKKNQAKGKNRWERRKYSRIATRVSDYNKIDMDAFFRGDILDFVVNVQGETNNYDVLVTFEDILHELQSQIKGNKNKLEFKCVLRALINQFNKGSVYVSCSCPDFTYRQAYWATKGQYNSGTPQTSNGKMIANPNDTKGAGCKHVNLVLANLDWIMKIASVINNYIYWARDNMEYQYGKLIFPKLYGMPYDKAIQLTLDMYDENGNLKPEYTENKLRSDLDTINMSNMIGRARTQYKKKPQVSVNPRYTPPKKEQTEEETNELGLEFGEDKELVTDEENNVE